MTAVPLGETPSLCVLCPPQRAKVSRPGGQTDWDCHDRLQAAVVEIVNRYARLTARPGSGAAFDGGRRAPGFGSRPPVNLHNATLRDPRTHPAELGEAHAPLNFLLTWGRWIRTTRSQPPRGYAGGVDDLEIADIEGTYLFNSMDWITRQYWVVQFSEQMRAVVSQLRSATGEPNPRPVGWCLSEDCDHPLFPPHDGGINIRCGGCSRLYEPLDQIRMVHSQGQGCGVCGHEGSQHDNDSEIRPCNIQWCDCPGFAEDADDRAHQEGPRAG